MCNNDLCDDVNILVSTYSVVEQTQTALVINDLIARNDLPLLLPFLSAYNSSF